MSLMICLLITCVEKKAPKELVYKQFESDLDTLIANADHFLSIVKATEDKAKLNADFLKLRLTYKPTEAFAEYFFPTTVRLVNGAPLDEMEDEENAVYEPGGLQVIEELIYTDEAIDEAELIRHVRKLQVNLRQMKTLWKDIQITDSHVMDALRLELFRLITLGISGFDTPASGNALGESQEVLASFQRYATLYGSKLPDLEKLTHQADSAIDFIAKSKNFNDFDGATFIVQYINPLCVSLHESQKRAAIPFIKDRRMIRGDVATLFEPHAFDPEALVSNAKFTTSADRVLLGKKLFFDPRISGNGKTSCASCHQPRLAFTDGQKTSIGFENEKIKRNAPTIKYAALQRALFYDLRSPSLEDQAADVIHNKQEMRGSLQSVAKMIGSDSEYLRLFNKAFPKLDSIRPVYIQNAIATFVRSLNLFSSPFDSYMRGNKKALTDNQTKGFNLFMGKARCGTCHFVPLFNGTVPPDFKRTESEVLGVTVNAYWKNTRLDADLGRGAHNQFPQWKHAFKTGTLRNISKTAPYMHNGAYADLQQVMEFYNEGGGAGLGLEVPNQTLSADKLKLTQPEIELVIDFMESLSDQ